MLVDARQTIYLLEYDAETGLPADGWLDRSHLESASCGLLSPKRVRRSEPDIDAWPDSELPDDLAVVLRALTPPSCDTCVEFEETELILQGVPNRRGARGLAGLIVLPSGPVLVATAIGLLLIEGESDIHAVLGCSPGYSQILLATNDRIFASHGGRVEELEIDTSARTCVVRTATSTPYREIRELSASTRDEPLEILGVAETNEGELAAFRLDDVSLSEIGRFELPTLLANGEPSMARAGPARGFFSTGSDAVYRWEAGRVERMPIGPELELFSVRWRDGFGALAFVDQSGLTHVYQSPDLHEAFWLEFEFAQKLWDVLPFRGGLVGVSNSGVVNQYYETTGVCPGRPGFGRGNRSPRRLQSAGPERFVYNYMTHRTEEQHAVYWLAPKPRPPLPSELF